MTLHRAILENHHFVCLSLLTSASCVALPASHHHHHHLHQTNAPVAKVTCGVFPSFQLLIFFPFAYKSMPGECGFACNFGSPKATGRQTLRRGGATTRLIKHKTSSSTHCQGDALRGWQIAPTSAAHTQRVGMNCGVRGVFWRVFFFFSQLHISSTKTATSCPK